MKKILIGVCGGIACYKSLELVREFTQCGYQVNVIMTKSALRFIKPLSFQTLARTKVFTSLFDNSNSSEYIDHIELAQTAHILVISPATASIIGKFTQGLADDLLSTVLLAATCPIVIAPAMNTAMWNNVFVQNNIQKLQENNIDILSPQEGMLACGTYGEGKMSDIYHIQRMVVKKLILSDNDSSSIGSLKNKKVLVTAGATRESIDHFRHISNLSSGKMGLELAETFTLLGAQVTFLIGQVTIDIPRNLKPIKMGQYDQIKNFLLKNVADYDIIIMTIAISDYKPLTFSTKKIKDKTFTICLNKNDDILRLMAKNKNPSQVFVGFAAESEDVVVNGRKKLLGKDIDLVVANDITKKENGFGENSLYATLIEKDKATPIEEIKKTQLSIEIAIKVNEILDAKRNNTL